MILPFEFIRNKVMYTFSPLPTMTEDEVRKIVPEYKPAAVEPPVKKWTAEEMVKTFKAVDIKAWAKERGLKATGTELSVAQALLASGFIPSTTQAKKTP